MLVKIKDIATSIGSGITPLKSNEKFWNSNDIPWLKTDQLGQFEITEVNEYISQQAFEDTSIKKWPINTISVAMYGEGKTRGNVSILKIETTTNQACCNIVVDETKAYFKYVYYFLKANYLNLRGLSAGIRKNLNSENIKNFPIELPSLQIQKLIGDTLYNIDSKIANNNAISKELESMARTIYDYWFLQFEFLDEDGKPYKSNGGKMVWNDQLKQEIPEGWKVASLASLIAEIKGGDWGRAEAIGNYVEEVNCIRGADFPGIVKALSVDIPKRFINKKNKNKILESGDLIIEISGGSPIQSTGRICYINDVTLKRFSNPIVTSNFCKAIKLNNSWLSVLVFYFNLDGIYENDIFLILRVRQLV